MIAKTFADRLTEQADRLQDRRAELDAEIAKHMEREGELRGDALAIPPAGSWHECPDCGHEYSVTASGCPDCAADSWERAP